jgi:hypothetical protein
LGAETVKVLQKEVKEADCFIGVISSNSISSMYVEFELGVRWGAELSLIALLAPAIGANILQGPLTNLNALKADNKHQLEQLISDLGKDLSINKEPSVIYDNIVHTILNLPPELTTNNLINENTDKAHEEISLSDNETQILKLISDSNLEYLTEKYLSEYMKEKVTKIEHYLNVLRKKNMVGRRITIGKLNKYYLFSVGKAHLVENDLIYNKKAA